MTLHPATSVDAAARLSRAARMEAAARQAIVHLDQAICMFSANAKHINAHRARACLQEALERKL